jgi:iron complex outermembrane receptor protein
VQLRKQNSFVAGLGLSLTALSAAHAQPSPQASGGVDTIVVTERALQREAALTPGGIALIDAEDLSERNVATLADLLRYVPGVWSASNSGSDSMFFSSRGSNLDATDYDMNGIKLLQDGLPVTTADGNNHNRVLDPLAARYATVARGANALKYGASTLGGAVDFVSPTARNSSPTEVFVNTGSHGQLVARGTAGDVFSERFDALVTVEGKRWDGYRDHNQQQRAGVYANAGWQLGNDGDTRLFLTYLDNDQELPGSLTRQQLEADPGQANIAALTGNFQIDVETLRLANKTVLQLGPDRRLDFGFSLEEQSLFHPIVDVRIDFDGPGPAQPTQVFSLLVDTDHRELGGMLRYNQRVAAHDLSFGLNYGRTVVEGGDYSHDGGVPTGLMTIVDNDATGLELYALDRWQLSERVQLELGAQGVLADRNVVNIDAESGGVRNPNGDYSRLNPRFGIIYRVRDVDLFANLSGLYEPPTTFELEDEASGGNTVLDAMRGTVLEVGTRGRKSFGAASALHWDVALYYAQIDGEILSVDDPLAPGTSLSANIDATVHAGIEAVLGAELALGAGGWLTPLVSVTLNDFSFDGDPVYGNNYLPAAPGYVVRGELLWRSPTGFFAGPTFDVVGKRFADFTNTYRVDSYSLLGLRAGWSNERWHAFGELRNLADEEYVATHGVRDTAGANAAILNPGEPASVFLGVQARF